MPALLAGRDLSASYGSVRALQGVAIEVPEGAVAAVIGPNGAGKSTLLRTLSGLHRPDRGSVLFDGRDVTALPAHRLARLGVALIPEGRGVFPGLTVAENLSLAGRGGSSENALRAFPALRDRARQVAGTLSGGERQMLSLARVMAGRPRVVLLDEPSLALAPRLVDRIFEAVAAIRTSGTTVVLVEQYVRRALQIADLVYVLRKGRCIFAGEPDELRRADSLTGAYLGPGPVGAGAPG